jgi:hypothetical protein
MTSFPIFHVLGFTTMGEGTPSTASRSGPGGTGPSNQSSRSVFDEIRQPYRRALDEVVFDVLGLTAGEREAVYEAVVTLVHARLEKARSV